MNDAEKLIEEAAKAIQDRATWPSLHWPPLHALSHTDVARAIAEAALAVFEKAHTPTDDEREALAHLIGYELYAEQMAKAVGGRPDRSGFDSLGVVFKDTWLDVTRPIADVILAAGFRRSEVPEPSADRDIEYRASSESDEWLLAIAGASQRDIDATERENESRGWKKYRVTAAENRELDFAPAHPVVSK